jgi:hypothetical protein
MAQQNIDFGTFPDDPSADAIRTAFLKVQNNFTQLFNANVDQVVTSVNRTPGAGITVNYPTGNVVVSANIACLQVSTSSLRVGRGSDNTQSNVTITSSSQQLNIDINPAQVLSNRFASVSNGLANLNGTLTTDSNAQPNITSLGTLSNLTISGNLSVGNNVALSGNVNFTGANFNIANISNFHIQGGTLGYFLQTDGAGNLAWSAGGGGGNGSPGGINTYVQFNDTGAFGGNTGFTFNKVTGLFAAPNVSIPGNATVGNLLGVFANGNSNISIPSSNGNINVSAEGNANVIVVTGTGANITGTLSASGNANVGNISATLFVGNVSGTGNSNVGNLGFGSGQISGTGNITAGNFIGDGSQLTGLTAGSSLVNGNSNVIVNANANIAISSKGNANVIIITDTGANITGTLSASGNANVGNLNVANNAIINGNLSVLGNATYVNIESLVIEDPIISLGGGPNGDPLTTNDGKDRGVALQYYTSAPVTAFMGWDNSNAEFGFGSNVTISSEIVTFTNYGNARASYFIGDGTQFGNANLGNTATANFFVGRFYGNANAATIANTVVDNAQPNITSVGTLTSLAVTGNTTSGNFIGTLANGNSNIRIAADSNIGISAIGVSNVVVITGTGANITGTLSASGNVTVGNVIGTLANGNSNVNIATANGNVTITAVGNTTMTVTGTGANIAGTVSATGNVTGNFFIGNGSQLTGITVAAGSSILNGNSNITISANSNINMFVNGNATARVVVTNTGANIAGTLSVSGNITAGNVSATTFTGALSGAATSATTATTAGTVTTAAQGNITSVGTLTSLTVSGATSITGNSAFTVTNITTGANTTVGYLTGNWTLTTGSRMQATYADLAEYYAGDEQIEPGTVVEFGGQHEVHICNSYMSTLVAGIVTTDPAYIMNANINCEYPVAIALQGRIPAKVIGPVRRGDMMVSANNGYAISCKSPVMGTVLGKALTNFEGDAGIIEIMVGRT